MTPHITIDYTLPEICWTIFIQGVGYIALILVLLKLPEWWHELVQTFKDAKYKPVKDYDEVITDKHWEYLMKVAECYQPLFDHMEQDHNLILTISEMDDIIHYCEEVKKRINNLKNENQIQGKIS